MVLWACVSLVAAIVLILAAHRMEGGQTLGAKQAVYLAAFCALMLSAYNAYQWHSGRTAPAEVEAYLPVYPGARLKTRVPLEELRVLQNLFANEEEDAGVRGQWVFETSDSTADVARYYKAWAATAPHRVGVEQMMEYSEVLVDAPNYSFTVLANNHWSGTRITYTLLAPLD